MGETHQPDAISVNFGLDVHRGYLSVRVKKEAKKPNMDLVIIARYTPIAIRYYHQD